MTEMVPIYIYSGDELARQQEIYSDGVNAAVRYAMKADTDLGRLLRANDYFCVNFEYDTGYNIYSPELLFGQKKGVCQAYMLAFRAVLNELDITNITVSSKAINHTWNMVFLDGEWYHIDVTWNDPVSDMPLRACHNNFLLSDAGITATGHRAWIDGWDTVVEASSTRYDDYFWVDIKQVLPLVGDTAYYAMRTDNHSTYRTVFSFDLATGQNTEVCTYDYGYGSFYSNHNPLWVTGDTLYYAVRSNLYSMPLSGGPAQLAYSTGNSSVWLWYPYQSGSRIRMYASSTPQGAGSVCAYALGTSISMSLNETLIEATITDGFQLEAEFSPAQPDADLLIWRSSDESVATVNSNGLVTGVGPGAAEITAEYASGISAACKVFVHSANPLIVPIGTASIGDSAFANIGTDEIILPEGIETIGSGAFAENADLRLINLPSELKDIAADAFTGCDRLTLLCKAGSEGETYALVNEIPHISLP